MVALALIVGALPFLFPLTADARIPKKQDFGERRVDKVGPWLDDPHEKIGFTYGAWAQLQTNYIWRGMYIGGLSLQGSADVGYGGLYLDMWWNLGADDYAFTGFQPEMDLTLGFSRWGLDLSVMYVYNFNKSLFDFHNYAPGQGGNGLEVRARYTVSSKLPLSILWATRVSAKDGFINADGDLQRAYSSYLELSYTHHFDCDVSLFGALGITPWRSMYTNYEGGATVCNLQMGCTKSWQVSKHCGLRLTAQLMMNPYYLAHRDMADKYFDSRQLGCPALNGNIGFGVYLIK